MNPKTQHAEPTGGAGVRPPPGVDDPDHSTPTNKIFPNAPNASAPPVEHNPAPAESSPPPLPLGAPELPASPLIGNGIGVGELDAPPSATAAVSEGGVTLTTGDLQKFSTDDSTAQLRQHNKPLHGKHPQVIMAKRLEKARELVARMRSYVHCYGEDATNAWIELEKMFPVVVEKMEAPAVKAIGADDPPDTETAIVVGHCINKRMTVVAPISRTTGQPLMTRLMYGRANELRPALNKKVWMRPNPNQDEGGFVLWGDYNRYGDRLA